jgi:transketolase
MTSPLLDVTAVAPELTDAQLAHLRERALFVRLETLRLIEIAKVGHYASAFSAAEIFATLYYDTMRLRRGAPAWPDRDRFLMGKGHAAVGLYPILADWDFFPRELLDGYTRLGNPLGDHPDMRKVPGIDFSSGSIGHALSAGLGMTLAGRLERRDFFVYALLGDGEMQEGQVWEAAISAAHHGARNLVAIVDRNGYQLDGRVDDTMAIEPLAAKWRAFNWEVHEVDGHDVRALALLLRKVRADAARETPVCIIAHTIKGKGISYMETEPGWHLGYLAPDDQERAVAELRGQTPGGPLGAKSWHYREVNARAPGLGYLSRALCDLVDEGHPIVAGTADLSYSNGLVRFAKAHPERFIQFGISEKHMVSAAAGLAAAGMIPYVASFASFLALLTCEQIRTDAAYSALPVRLIGHHAGIALGFYGTSHHATEDLAITRSIADLVVIAPADGPQLAAAIKATVRHPQPIYFRIGRGQEPNVYPDDVRFELGKAVVHREGDELTLIVCGTMLCPAIAAVDALRASGRSVGLIDMPTIKPIDRGAILTAASRSGLILTVEEHNTLGGLGGAVSEVLAEAGAPARLVRHGIDDEYSLIAPPTHLYRHYRLDAAGIEAVAREAME